MAARRFASGPERSMRTANPSHTGHIATALSEFKTVVRMDEGGGLIFHPEAVAAAEAAGWLGSKLFHSRAGVRLLTKGLSQPVGDVVGTTALINEMRKLGEDYVE